MIRYRLLCSSGHDFEAWFRSADDCDTQIDRNLVACGVCGDTALKKALMAPGVVTSRQKAKRPTADRATPPALAPAPAPASASAPPAPVAAIPQEAKQVMAAMRQLRDKITEASDYVGPKFTEEARKIHYGEAAPRPIHGEATLQDAKALTEEGVKVMPLPVLPEDRN